MNKIIHWFIENSVAVTLLMAVILLGGSFSLIGLNKETVPAVTTGLVQITASYPGAGPKEVEEQIVIRIEEAIGDLDGIKEMSSTAKQSHASITIEAIQDYNIQKLLNNIENRVAMIDTFPADTERVQVREIQWQQMIMNIGVVGNVEESALKETAEQLREDLARLPNISVASLQAIRNDELTIEISESNLRRYNLSFQQVANAIRSSSLNLPAGTIKSVSGDVQLQTRGQSYFADDFKNIVISSNRDGGKLLLDDIATISDSFVDSDFISMLNGKPAVYIQLFITDNPNVLKARDQVLEFLDNLEGNLPAGIDVKLWQDTTEMFKDRMNLLIKNASSGLLLVFIVLMLFLRPALAAWVCVGISLSFLGAIWFMPYFNVTINMLSLFGFLLVLGIVVDDAIIVGESIYSQNEQGLSGTKAASMGTKIVGKPVVFAVISTMIFFTPLLFIPGAMGTMAAPIAVIVILCLVFSLIESLLILPSHLAHIGKEKKSSNRYLKQLALVRESFSRGLQKISDDKYVPLLKKATHNNIFTISCFGVVFFIALAIFAGGWLRVGFMPIIQSDFIEANITLGEGVPFSETKTLLNTINNASLKLQSDPELIEANSTPDFVGDIMSFANGNQVTFVLALKSPDQRKVSTALVAERWEKLIGTIPNAEEFRINYTINTRSADIRLRASIASDDTVEQEQAIAAVESAIASYPGTYNIKNNSQSPRDEIELALRKNSEALGFNLSAIATQVRQGFYGEEVQRIPREKEDVKVMLRYPEDERNNVDQLQLMRIRSAEGFEVPLQTVADAFYVPGYSTIKRLDRKRSIIITADTHDGHNANEIVVDLLKRNLPNWKRQFPRFNLTVDGDLRLQMEFMESIVKNFLFALLMIYGLMAIAFRSYWQPIIVLTAIPFGFMGAIIGHILMGREISMMSMLGFVACAGVVVNDNLVLLDRINHLCKSNKTSVYKAVITAASNRFRAIVLTSVTTFIGLTPILFETSMQARFLIPMVISLSFGVICATTVTLILVPSLFMLGDKVTNKESKTNGSETVVSDNKQTKFL